jgi:hypothetical protein
MSSQRYQPVSEPTADYQYTFPDLPQITTHDDDEVDSPIISSGNNHVPTSPPPSFRSRDSSPTSRRLLDQDPLNHDGERDLEDAFGDGSDDENEEDDRQRLMRANPTDQQVNTTSSNSVSQPAIERRVTELPAFRAPARPLDQQANDGVFANLGAKLERGEQVDEKPPVRTIPRLMMD